MKFIIVHLTMYESGNLAQGLNLLPFPCPAVPYWSLILSIFKQQIVVYGDLCMFDSVCVKKHQNFERESSEGKTKYFSLYLCLNIHEIICKILR